jgi:hypothetical protein
MEAVIKCKSADETENQQWQETIENRACYQVLISKYPV